jgi:hypothetical protein
MPNKVGEMPLAKFASVVGCLGAATANEMSARPACRPGYSFPAGARKEPTVGRHGAWLGAVGQLSPPFHIHHP